MTRWINIVDVYWIPPQRRQKTESVVDLTNRVKALISDAAGLKNLSWDGYLKNYRPTSEKQAKMRSTTRHEYQKELKGKLAMFASTDENVCLPTIPARDYFPDWLSDDSRTAVLNEIMQKQCS
jgi:hypothetical protein